MTYITSWDINVFLCLLSLGLPSDLIISWMYKIKGNHREFTFEETRDYYCNRQKLFPKVGKRVMLLSDQCKKNNVEPTIVNYYDKQINIKVLNDICLPHNNYINMLELNHEYEDLLKKVEPYERYKYFKYAYENKHTDWAEDILDWVKGFHVGRFILMDLKRIRNYKIETMENIRDFEDIGPKIESKFIRKQRHIKDIIESNKNDYSQILSQL